MLQKRLFMNGPISKRVEHSKISISGKAPTPGMNSFEAMKTAGLLGGMAWPSTLAYYALLNKEVERRAGVHHSVKCIIYSFDFDEINPSYRSDEEIVNRLRKEIKMLIETHPDILLLCSNTMHRYAAELNIDRGTAFFLDIRDCVGSELVKNNHRECLLLGTLYTMQNSFYSAYLEQRFGIKVTVPTEEQQLSINNIIFNELINNITSDSAQEVLQNITDQYAGESIVLACTELRLIFDKIKTTKNIIDSTTAHVTHAADYLLK